MTEADVQRALDRLRAKHKRFAEATNRLLTEQHHELARLRAQAEHCDCRNPGERRA